jgi:hypothetical protein
VTPISCRRGFSKFALFCKSAILSSEFVLAFVHSFIRLRMLRLDSRLGLRGRSHLFHLSFAQKRGGARESALDWRSLLLRASRDLGCRHPIGAVLSLFGSAIRLLLYESPTSAMGQYGLLIPDIFGFAALSFSENTVILSFFTLRLRCRVQRVASNVANLQFQNLRDAKPRRIDEGDHGSVKNFLFLLRTLLEIKI